MIKILMCSFLMIHSSIYSMDNKNFVYVRNTADFQKIPINNTTTVQDIIDNDKMRCSCVPPHTLYICNVKCAHNALGPLESHDLIMTLSEEYDSIYFERR